MEKFVWNRAVSRAIARNQVPPFAHAVANIPRAKREKCDNLAGSLTCGQRSCPIRCWNSYSEERVHAADENILNSTRATDFLTPKTKMSKIFRDRCSELAMTIPFARFM